MSEPILRRELVTHGNELPTPVRVESMAAQECFRVGAGGGDGGLELSDDTSATDDRVSLTAVLNTIEQVGETSRRFSCGYFDHNIRLSDT